MTAENQTPARVWRWDLTFFAVFTLLGFAIRLVRVGDASYWGDELVSVTVGQLPAVEIPGWLGENDPHPPLYYLLLHWWMLLTGPGEFATRYLSVLLGTAGIPLIGALGRRMFGAPVAIAAMLLLAVNPLHIAQARDARMYPLTVALTLASVLLLWEIIRRFRQDRAGHALWIAYVLVSAAGLYSHYYAGLVLVAEGVFMLGTFFSDRRLFWRWTGAAFAIGVLYLPWVIPGIGVVSAYEGYTWSPGEAGAESLLTSLRLCLDVFASGPWSVPDPYRPVIEVYLLAALAAGLIAAARRPRRVAIFLVLYLLTPILTIYVASLARPIFTPKYLIAASPAFYLLLAAGTASVVRSRFRLAPALALAVMAPLLAVEGIGAERLLSDPKLANADWRSAAAYVTAREQPGDGLIYGHDGIKWLFGYYHRSPLDEYIPPFGTEGHEREIDNVLKIFSAEHSRIWFVPWWQSETDVYVERWLNQNAYKITNRWMSSIRITSFASPAGAEIFKTAAFDYGGQLKLEGWSLDKAAGQPGDVLRLALRWDALDDLENNVKVLVKLVGPDGRNYQTIDRLPRDGTTVGWNEGTKVTDRYGLLIPPGTPPGTYRIDLDLYHEETGERLTPANPNAAGARVILGEIRVEDSARTFPAAAVEAEMLADKPFGDLVRLAGFTFNEQTLRPGDFADVTLYWRQERAGEPVNATLSLGSPGKGPSTLSMKAGMAGRPVGAIQRVDASLRIRPGTAAGNQDVWLSGDGATPLKIGTVHVVIPPAAPAPAPPEKAINAIFKGVGSLTGSTVRKTQAGLEVSLVWQAANEIETGYVVFVQALDRDGNVVAQSDQAPAAGAAPTSGWTPGLLILDRHTLALRDVPAGGTLIAGMYDPRSFQRVQLAAGGDSVSIPLQ